ncbi:MAG: UDP-glucose 4-epimerase GalE [Rhodocyclaceae bacterium]|nr:UDP-glucose 4-epimerase GalE [Rhodocyclaceae bacterium]
MSVILVTGGAGYIGSHTCLSLLEGGYDVVVIDNYSNSSPVALDRVEALAGRPLRARIEGDVRNRALLAEVMAGHRVDAVVHFAALKAVGESNAMPLAYYDNNVSGTVALAEAMRTAGVSRLVFSSSATVYGDPASVPIREDFPTGPTNPYGRTKWMMEFVLQDLAASAPDWSIALLRYFNPVGAHASGLIGEDPNGIPNNLMPFISQVAVGRREALQVFGDDYPTPDGTGVRDYIHVVDLADGHVKTLERMLSGQQGVLTLNLGTGRGYSVLEVVRAFEQASGRSVPYRIVARRPGDVAECWADPSSATEVLGWRAQRGIEEMCADAWRWQSGNPNGYADR